MHQVLVSGGRLIEHVAAEVGLAVLPCS
jgi:hypothetical protein